MIAMTLADVTPRMLITGTGSLGPFSLTISGSPIRFTSNSHIRVTRYTASGVGTVLVEGTDYTLTGGPNAGVVTLTSPQTVLLSSEKLVVERIQPFAQDLALALANSFPSSSVEARLDKLTEYTQDINSKVQRALAAHPLDTTTPSYPYLTDRKSRWAKWDDTGALVAGDPPSISALTSGQMILDERYFANADGVTSSWTFTNFIAPTGYAVEVYIDGVRQYLSDYSISSPTSTSTAAGVCSMSSLVLAGVAQAIGSLPGPAEFSSEAPLKLSAPASRQSAPVLRHWPGLPLPPNGIGQ
jgi:hypothetical protein